MLPVVEQFMTLVVAIIIEVVRSIAVDEGLNYFFLFSVEAVCLIQFLAQNIEGIS
jgi:hypothetical protein